MEFRVLGPLEVVDGDRLLDLGRPRQRALLACLLVHANEVVTTERLREELWRDASAAATNPLQVAVSRLRKTLGTHERLVTRAPGYVLLVEPGECDRDVFERLVSEGRQLLAEDKAEAAAKALREALALWRGPPFADFLYEPFAQAETARLEEARLGCLESRLEADLALGRHAEVIGELEALTTEHPLRERFRGQLMVALYRSGRQADALATYQAARRLLVEELGIEPSSELRELHQAILRQDSELQLPAPPRPLPEAPAEDVSERTAPGVARKTVTVLVAELADEARPRRVDPELRRRFRDRSFDMIAPVLRSHGAAVEGSRDDRVVGVFGVPAAHEDDALRAVRAAAELRAALDPGQLERLSRDDSSRLIGALPAGAGLAPETEARIAAAADGNPLFLEQMLAMLAHDDDGVAQIAVPPAIQALLAARLDSLDAEERRVLECASVEGEAFHVGAVVELVAAETASAVESRLLGLVRKELIRPESAALPGEDAFRFRHALIRDAAYERLPKEARSELHERYGVWLEQARGDHTAEGEEFLGYHFEQAFRYRAELGEVGAKDIELADRACRRLLSAGRQAFRRGDTEAAVNLLERARSISFSDERGWLELAPDVGYALFQAGEFERARRILDDALEQASASGDRLAERHAWVVRDYSRLFNEPDQIDLAEALRDAEASIELFEGAGDHAALSRASNFVWHLYQCVGEAPPIREMAERSLEHAKLAGSAIDEAWSLALLVYSLLEGPTPADEAVLACERLLQELSSSLLGQATVNTHLAPLLAIAGPVRGSSSNDRPGPG